MQIKENYNIEDLREIMRVLRSENGCPWDREQDHKSIRKNFLEETYEVLEAIDTDNVELLREELGDVLLQVVFHTQMEEEKNSFTFENVCDEVCKKLIHRHPHIFSDTVANTSEEVLKNWDEIKKKEKNQKTATQTLESVPEILPALMRAEKIIHRAKRAGLETPNNNEIIDNLIEKLQKLKNEELINEKAQKAELEELTGDFLLNYTNLSGNLGIDSEKSLTNALKTFINKMRDLEETAIEQNIDINKVIQLSQTNFW